MDPTRRNARPGPTPWQLPSRSWSASEACAVSSERPRKPGPIRAEHATRRHRNLGRLMPTAPPHPCAYPGCGVRLPRGKSHCRVHQQQRDRARGTTTQRGLGWDYQVHRVPVLERATQTKLTETTEKARRPMACGTCGKDGHNTKTCGQPVAKTASKAAPRAPAVAPVKP